MPVKKADETEPKPEQVAGSIESTTLEESATLSVTVGGKINLGNYNNVDIVLAFSAPMSPKIEPDELAELVRDASTTLERGIGYVLADMLRYPQSDAIWQDANAQVERLIASHSGSVVKGNPFAMRCLRLVIDEYSEENADDINF